MHTQNNTLTQKPRNRAIALLLVCAVLLGILPSLGEPAFAAGGEAPPEVTLTQTGYEDGDAPQFSHPDLDGTATIHLIEVQDSNGQTLPAMCLNHGLHLGSGVKNQKWNNPEVYSLDDPYLFWSFDKYIQSVEYENKGYKPEDLGLLSEWGRHVNVGVAQVVTWFYEAGKIPDWRTDKAGYAQKINELRAQALSAMGLGDGIFSMTNNQVEQIVDYYTSTNTLKHYSFYRYHYAGSFSYPDGKGVQDLLVAVPIQSVTDPKAIYIKLNKTQADGNTPLTGALFGVYTDSNCSSPALLNVFTTDTKGVYGPFVIEGPTATLYIKELKAPSGYEPSTTVKSVFVDGEANSSESTPALVDGGTAWVNVATTSTDPQPPTPPTPSGTAQGVLTKVDSNTGLGIGPATFHFAGVETPPPEEEEEDETLPSSISLNVPIRNTSLFRTILSGNDFELPIEGSTGWPIIDTKLYADQGGSSEKQTITAGTPFTILGEIGDMWHVKTASDEGWVKHAHCMINLPDVIPSIVYNNTNSYKSIYMSSGFDLSGITGTTLYTAYAMNYRLGYKEFSVPVMYSMAKEIASVQKAALASGDTLVIYEGYRPASVQEKVKNGLDALMSSQPTVKQNIEQFGKQWFIAQGVSAHQRGLAIDTSLAKVTGSSQIHVGDNTVSRVTSYEEYKMPSAMHELSSAARTFEKAVGTSDTAWKSAQLASTMTEGAKKLQKYCTDQGMIPLCSEWWHFYASTYNHQDETVKAATKGNYSITGNMSTIPSEAESNGGQNQVGSSGTAPSGGINPNTPGQTGSSGSSGGSGGSGSGTGGTGGSTGGSGGGVGGGTGGSVGSGDAYGTAGIHEYDFTTDASGNLTLQWGDPSGSNYIAPGTYYVTEKVAPKGYELNTEGQWVEFAIDEDGNQICKGPLVFANDKLHTLTIRKYSEDNIPLAGATFEIYRNGQLLATETTDAKGEIRFFGKDEAGIESGYYEVKETKAPDGYLLPERNVYGVNIDASDTTVVEHVVSFTDYRYADIVIHKTAAGTTRGLAGAKFEVFIDAQKVGEFVTDNSGNIILDYGTYGKFLSDSNESWTVGVREIAPPDGYMLNDKSLHQAELRKGQDLVPFEFEDTKYPEITIFKRDAETAEPLAGATFEVKIDGKDFGTLTSDEHGIVKITYDDYERFLEEENLSGWTVEVREKTAPGGYLLDDPDWQQAELKFGQSDVTFSFTDTKYPEIIIIKRDRETGAVLPNTTFRILIDGVEFGTRVTDDEGKIVISYEEYARFLDEDNFENWTITVTEVEMPDKYNKDKQESTNDYTITQQLKRNQSLSVFEFKDTHYRDIKVTKYDSQTHWLLAGATFRLHCVKADDLDAGSIADRELTTDGTGTVIFEDVPNGTYELTEIEPPMGYDTTSEKITVVVTSDSDPVLEYSFENAPLSGMLIRKTDSATKQPLENVEFRITPLAPLTGPSFTRVTNASGLIVIEDLEPGTYRVEEVTTADGYVLNTEPQLVEIKNQHDSYVVYFENNQKGMLNVLKLDAITKEPLANAIFSVYTVGGTFVANITTGIYGYATLPNLKPGSYVVREIMAPAGHILDPNPQFFEVLDDDAGRVYTLVFCDSPYTDLYLRKYDAFSNIGLENAHFRVWKNDTLIADDVVTDEAGFIHIGEQTGGMFQIQETIAPKGYLLNNEIYFIYLEDGQTGTVEIPDYQPGSISVHKTDAYTGAELEGATFELSEVSGKVIGSQTTGADGYARWSDLAPGWYVLKEIEAPDGYVLDKNPRNVEVKQFESTKITWENAQKGSLTVIKKDKATDVPLANATFEIRDMNGTLITTVTTGLNGTVTTSRLSPGWYRVVETVAPFGYDLNTKEYQVQVKENEPATVTVLDEQLTGITVKKVDSRTKAPLANATYELYTNKGVLIDTYTTDNSGVISTRALEPDVYILKEIKAPDGYILDETEHRIEVKAGEQATITLNNTAKSTIQVFKTDKTTGTPLVDARYEIFSAGGKSVDFITTDATGWGVSKPLDPGEYYIVERDAPNGYVLDPTPYYTKVTEGESSVVRVEDIPESVLYITKIDNYSREPIAGVVFEVYSGLVGTGAFTRIGQYVTDEHGIAVTEPLQPGPYAVKEISVPPEYILDSAYHDVIVRAGEYNNLVVENQKAATLIVRKIDSKTGRPIPGAVFKLESADRMDLVGTLETDANGEAIFTGLKEGAYIVTETQAPSGYELDEKPERTIYVEYNKRNYCDFKDAAKGSLVIVLQEETTGKPLYGGEFRVTRESDQIVVFDGSTDTTGTIVVGNLTPGWYYVEQLYAPDTYTMVDVDKHIEVLSGEQQTVYFNGVTAGIVIEKVDSAHPELMLEGARFQLVRNSDGIVIGEYVTGKDGKVTVKGLMPGMYTVKELAAPNGYAIDESSKTVDVKGGTMAHVTFMDTALAGLTVHVVDENNKKGVSGAVVEVWQQNGVQVNSYTTDPTGVIETDKLPDGYYTLRLTYIPDGYSARVAEATVQIKRGVPVTYTFNLIASSNLKISTVTVTNIAVPNVTVEVTTLKGTVIGTYTTGPDGTVILNDVEAGWYVVTPKSAPKGYEFVNAEPMNIEVESDKMATVSIKLKMQSSMRIRIVDGDTGAGLYKVRLQVRDADNGRTITEYYSDNQGYVVIDRSLATGKTVIEMLSAPKGYIVDTVPKSVEVLAASTTEVTWRLYKEGGQIQVLVRSENYNATLDKPAGSALQGAVFEITNADTYQVVDTVISDVRGVAASSPLPIGRYTVRQISAAPYYKVSEAVNEVRLKINNDVVQTSYTNQSVSLKTAISIKSNSTIKAGSSMRVDILDAMNGSDVALDNFYVHIKIPTDASRISSFSTGAWDKAVRYSVSYKTNMRDYTVLASNLISTNVYSYDLSSQSLRLQSGEYVTDIRCEYGTVPAGFQLKTKMCFTEYVLVSVYNGYLMVNRVENGGHLNTVSVSTSAVDNNNPYSGSAGYGNNSAMISGNSGAWSTGNATWNTTVKSSVKMPSSLPKTGF